MNPSRTPKYQGAHDYSPSSIFMSNLFMSNILWGGTRFTNRGGIYTPHGVIYTPRGVIYTQAKVYVALRTLEHCRASKSKIQGHKTSYCRAKPCAINKFDRITSIHFPQDRIFELLVQIWVSHSNNRNRLLDTTYGLRTCVINEPTRCGQSRHFASVTH